MNELITLLAAICGICALYCFVAGEITGNSSQMDKIWSIMPAVYVWIVAVKSGFSARVVIMAILATLWGLRLTFNFARKGAYSWKFWAGEEDYRWGWLRKQKYFSNRWVWAVFDLIFISIYQNILVLLTVTPAVVAYSSNAPLGWIDAAAGIFTLGFLALETVADEQQWRFQTTKWGMIKKGKTLEELPYPYCVGFNTTGLWVRSRHPNYLGEQGIWASFYIFSIASGAAILNWSIIGAVLLILLFMGSSTLGEYISSSKYPEYRVYKKAVCRYFPGRKYVRSGSDD